MSRLGKTQTQGQKTSDFVARARKIHSRKYDYSQVAFINQNTRVHIICRVHGAFRAFPNNHLRGHGCSLCARKEQALTRKKGAADTFVAKAKRKHGGRYDYSKTVYKGAGAPVRIYCRKHKLFFRIIANNHLQGRGCQKCGRDNQLAAADRKKQLASNAFVAKARKVHGRKYDYSEVVYNTSKTPVTIRCVSGIHGAFRQAPNNHLLGKGCPKCGSNALSQRTLQRRRKQFLKQARKVHGKRYGYSEVQFKNTDQKVIVNCRRHGGFQVRPTHHTSPPYSGCPACVESLGESAIRRFLKRSRIPFVSEKRFSDCRDKRPLAFDFWVPSYNALIEYDGEQHFNGSHYLSSLSDFRALQRRDRIKTAYARKKRIRLIRVKYTVQDLDAFLMKKLNLSSRTSAQ